MGNDLGESAAPALERGLRLLEMAAASCGGLGFNDLVSGSGIPSASVARLLRVLVGRGYLEKNPESGLYRPGAALARLVEQGTRESRLLAAAENVLSDLRELAGHTATLFLWEGEHIRCAAKCPHENSLSMQEIGQVRTDILAFPWGWIFADSLPEDEVKSMVKRLPTREMTLERYRKGVPAYHRNGFAHDGNPEHPWTRFAAPVRDGDGGIFAAVALGVPRCPLADDEIMRLGQLVKAAAGRLSATTIPPPMNSSTCPKTSASPTIAPPSSRNAPPPSPPSWKPGKPGSRPLFQPPTPNGNV